MIQLAVWLVCALATLHHVAADQCSDGHVCPEACCPTGNSNEYYCCARRVDETDRVYLLGIGSIWKDYWALIIGLLIASLIISIICSVLCCLYCNGCLWHRRRNPDLYAGAFPLGTIIYSPYVGPLPHPHHPPSYYDESPDSSIRSGAGGNRRGVRFDQDTVVKTYDNQPKSALKKPNGGVPGRNSPNLLL